MKRGIALAILIIGNISILFGQATFNSPSTGTTALGSYFSTDIDSVSLTNGNLNLMIPLFSLPGREIPLTLGASYNSQFIEQRTAYDEYGDPYSYWEFYGARKLTNVGGIISAGMSLQNPDCDPYPWDEGFGFNGCTTRIWTLTIQWVKNDGTKYTFTTTGNQNWTQEWDDNGCEDDQWEPAEGSLYDNLTLTTTGSEFLTLTTGMYFDPSPPAGAAATIYSKDGTQTIFYNGSWETRTTNGNRLQASGSTTSSHTNDGSALEDILPLSDTVGRNVSYSGGDAEMITLTDANGNNQVYTINWEDIPAEITYEGVTMLTATYRVMQSIGLPNGKSYQFSYDATGNLSKVVLPSGGYIRYTYGFPLPQMPVPMVLTQRIVSSDGTAGSEQTWNYSYNYQIAYNQDNGDGNNWYWWLQNTTVTDPTGSQEVHNFATPGCNDGAICVGMQYSVQTFQGSTLLKEIDDTWSDGSNPAIETVEVSDPAPAALTDYTYDSYNNITEEDDYTFSPGSPNGSITRATKWTYVSTSPYTTSYIYNRPLTKQTYDASNNLVAETDYGYDDYTDEPLITRSGTIPGWISPGTRGNVTSVKQWLNTNSSWLTSWSQYDVLGNVVATTDPAGYTTSIDFTDNFVNASGGGTPTFAFPTKTTSPSGFYATKTYDFNTGLVTQSEDALGRITSNTYDLLNRVTRTNLPNGGYTAYTYDDTTPAVTRQVLVDSSGNVGTVKTTYDLLYREIQRETWDPEGHIFVDTQYDAKGRKLKVSNPYRAGDTEVWTQYAYDAADRVITTTGPDGSTIQSSFSGTQTTVTDEAGNARRYTYDGLGRMTMVEEPSPTLATPVATTYTYNPLGKMIGSNQSGQTRTWVYDSLGRLTSQALPESGTTSFTYDSENNLLTKTDARGITTTMTYGTSGGSINQLVSRTYSDSTPSVSFTYNAQGLRTGMTDGLGSVSYTYDPETNKLTQESRILTGISGTFTTGYSYNIKGDMTSMTYPSGRVVNYGYETGGGCCNSRLESVTDATTGVTMASSISYNGAGGKLSETLNPGTNGIAEAFTYNNRNQLTEMTAAIGATTVMDLAYGYGISSTNTGRVLSRTDNIQPEHSVNYDYDSIYRLQQVESQSATWAITWTFDVWGNRLTQAPEGVATLKVGTQTLGYVNNRNTSYTYDAAGNVTNDGVHTYTYNAENQVTSMDGGGATYAYDGAGRRMVKTVSSVSDFSFYGGADTALLCEFTTSNTGATSASSSDTPFYHTTDYHRSAVLVITAAGMVIENNRTLPHGEEWLTDTASTNNKKFTSYERDTESGLDYAMNRYYSNNTGRYQSPGNGTAQKYLPSTLNQYVYTSSDPINQTNPAGSGMAGSSIVRPRASFDGCDASFLNCYDPCSGEALVRGGGIARIAGDGSCDDDGDTGDGDGGEAPAPPSLGAMNWLQSQ